MKRILHIITTIERGGAENQLLILIREQIRLGNHVSVLYLKGKPELLPELESIGCNTLDIVANKNFIKQLLISCRIDRRKFDIVHAHLPRAEIFSALSFPKVVLVASKHNAEDFFPSAPKLISKWLAKIVLLKFSRIICISKAVLEALVNLEELPRDLRKVSVIYYGYSPEKFVESDMRLVPNLKTSEEIIFGTVSRLAPQKDLPTMIGAISKLRDLGYKCKLKIFGDGPLREVLAKEISCRDLDNIVSLEGRTDKPELVIANFQIFLLSSKYEGFGLVLLEAMQCNTPIVAAKNSAIVEVLGDEYPWYFETGNSANMADVLIKMIDGLNMVEIREYYRARLIKFNPNKMAREIEEIYEELLP